jgi:RNA polymerase sigma-70 factor (ECF subfamily)
MEASELERVRRARGGDAEAFREIVECYSRSLWKATWRVLGDGPAAEDAVQEAFLRAWKSLSTFDERAELSTWLYRIAVNAAIDQRRSRRRRIGVTQPLPEDLNGESIAVSEEPGPDRRARSAEVARRTREALESLPDGERTALLLRHFEGRSIAEIAQVLAKSENAAKQTVFRAVQKLRSALAPLTDHRPREARHGEPA